jgi:hypothetical protein
MVAIRPAASYCAILVADNNRKPICRLRFNNPSRLVLGLFNENKEEERITIASVDDIFDCAEKLKVCVSAYLKQNTDDSAVPIDESEAEA